MSDVAKKKAQKTSEELEIRIEEAVAKLANSNEELQIAATIRILAKEELKQGLKRLRKRLKGTVNALVATIEKRDAYTAGHQQRVAKLAGVIAKEMNCPEEEREGLFVAANLHDIGKICIPAEILNKSSKLNGMEIDFIRTHPQVGYEILNPIEFDWPVAQTVLQHHERLDGSGYPAGLNGTEIILEAKILSVADVVEAMSSHRPYRPSRGIDNALEEISSQRGVLYDTIVVDACLTLFADKGFKLSPL